MKVATLNKQVAETLRPYHALNGIGGVVKR